MPELTSSFEILLDEIRTTRTQTSAEILALRHDVTAWQQQYGERLADVEKSVRVGIDGNGTPSRLRVVEVAIEGLQKFRYGLLAASTAVGSIVGSGVTIGLQFLPTLLHGR